MIATIWPGLDRLRGRRGDVGVDVADRDRDALGQAGPRGRLGGERAGRVAELADLAGRACPRRSGEAGFSAARKSRVG